MAIKYVLFPSDINTALSDFLQLLNLALKAGQSRAFPPLPLDLLDWTLNHEQRLAKWFTTLSPKEKAKIIKDVSQLVLARRTRMCNFLEYKGTASLHLMSATDLHLARFEDSLPSLCLSLLHRRMRLNR